MISISLKFILYPLLWLISIVPLFILNIFSIIISPFFTYRRNIILSNIKLAFPKKNDGEIKKGFINSESSFLRGRKRWELMNSIGIRDLEKSIKLAKSIINSSESMVSMIFPLMTFFQEILFFKMNDGTFIKPNSYIPLSRSIQNNLGDFSRNYRKDEIELAIRKLKEIEIKQKTSNIDDETEFISFLYNAIG